MEVPRLSKSRILQYCKCPQQYKLVNINNVPFTTSAMSKGTWFHEVAEKFFNYYNYNETQPKDFEGILRKIVREKYDEHKKWFENFIKFETERFNRLPPIHYRPKYREVKIILDGLSGVIDRIDFEPEKGTYLLIDYKTERVTNIKNHIFEMTVYAYLFREQFKKFIPNVGIWCADNGKLTTTIITEEHIEEMKRIIKQVQDNIKADYFPISPKNCWFCPRNIKDICHIVNKEEWIKYNKELIK